MQTNLSAAIFKSKFGKIRDREDVFLIDLHTTSLPPNGVSRIDIYVAHAKVTPPIFARINFYFYLLVPLLHYYSFYKSAHKNISSSNGRTKCKQK